MVDISAIQWDKVGERFYETGVDRGVLFPPVGPGVPWNGLISVVEQADGETLPYFMDGIKYLDSESLSTYKATLQAITYPDEFEDLQGSGDIGNGLSVQDQPQRSFNLAYRTLIGDDVSGTDLGYELHLLYNITAHTETMAYSSLKRDPSLTVFSWSLTGVPEVVSGFRPTSHVVIDSTQADDDVLPIVEALLYGVSAPPRMPSLSELFTIFLNWNVITIIDNGDGTWTANMPDSDYLTMLDSTTFQITDVDATFLDANTYQVSTTTVE